MYQGPADALRWAYQQGHIILEGANDRRNN
nr:MAG TPA: hypothetical protein [Caudoviricetes sp.]